LEEDPKIEGEKRGNGK